MTGFSGVLQCMGKEDCAKESARICENCGDENGASYCIDCDKHVHSIKANFGHKRRALVRYLSWLCLPVYRLFAPIKSPWLLVDL